MRNRNLQKSVSLTSTTTTRESESELKFKDGISNLKSTRRVTAFGGFADLRSNPLFEGG